jgi:hypothetical protein
VRTEVLHVLVRLFIDDVLLAVGILGVVGLMTLLSNVVGDRARCGRGRGNES